MKERIFTKRDILLLCAVLLAALLSLLLRGRAPVHTVNVYLDDALYASLPLGEDATLVIDQPDGKHNEIVLRDGAVYMAHANCKGQDCVLQGAVTAENREKRALGGWIICLPNRVSVELVGDA